MIVHLCCSHAAAAILQQMLLCCCLSLSLDPPSLNPAGVVGCCVAFLHLLLLQGVVQA